MPWNGKVWQQPDPNTANRPLLYTKIDEEVIYSIEDEMQYQDRKFGIGKEQSFPGYLTIIQSELDEARRAWTKGPWSGRDSALAEIVQIATVAIRCLEQYGVEGCPAATNDTVVEIEDSFPIKYVTTKEKLEAGTIASPKINATFLPGQEPAGLTGILDTGRTIPASHIQAELIDVKK